MDQETCNKVGTAVKVVDEVGVLHHGLVTNCWGGSCLNVAFLSADESKVDQYGRQTEHLSSCSHRDGTTAPGRYWFIAGEVKPETVQHYGRKEA
jgi:hypothetical protein